MTRAKAARAVSDDVQSIRDKFHRALHDQILECLEAMRGSGKAQPSGSRLELLRLGPGGRFRAAIEWHDGQLALLAVGQWHDHALQIAGHSVTRFKLRSARGFTRKGVRATLLTRDDQVIGIVMPAPRDAGLLEALILECSPKLHKLLARRLASLNGDDGLTVGEAFGIAER